MSGRFRAEIREQPEVLSRVLERSAGPAARLAAAIRSAEPAVIVIAARGSSHHAAVHARYLFEVRNRIPVSIAAPSVYTRYGTAPALERAFVIGISQSGRAADVAEVLAAAGRTALGTAAVTNDPGSELAALAGHVLPISAGDELSVPASKTYTATLTALNLVSAALGSDAVFEHGLHSLPELVARVLELEPELARIAGTLAVDRALVVGRGFQLATALEIALKLTEAAAIGADGLGAADLLHGPIAAVRAGLPALLVDDGGPTHEEIRSLAESLAAKGSRVATLTTAGVAADPCVRLPATPHPALSAIALTVAGQLLALYAAAARGLDPDQPRGLKKVTVTL